MPSTAAKISDAAATAPPQASHFRLLAAVTFGSSPAEHLVPDERHADDHDRGDDRGDQPARRIGRPSAEMTAAGQIAAGTPGVRRDRQAQQQARQHQHRAAQSPHKGRRRRAEAARGDLRRRRRHTPVMTGPDPPDQRVHPDRSGNVTAERELPAKAHRPRPRDTAIRTTRQPHNKVRLWDSRLSCSKPGL